MSEEKARQQKASKTQHEAECAQWLERLCTELKANEHLAKDSNATPDQLQRRVSEASAVLVQALFLTGIDSSASSSITQEPNMTTATWSSPPTELVQAADNLRKSTEQLEREHSRAKQAQDLMLQTYRLLDILNHDVESSLSSFPVSIQLD